jgi:drug/metabolite transporter (DMT)-like permease
MLFKKSGEHLSAAALNYFKNAVALVLFGLTLLVTGFDDAGPRDIGLLMLSGALGIGIADTLFFHALNVLGAGRIAVVECLYSSAVVAFSVLLLHEKLTWMHGAGGALILVGVVLSQQQAPVVPLPRAIVVRGALAGCLAMGLMALGIVIAKPVLEHHTVVWSTSMRLLGGLVVLTAGTLVHAPTRRDTLRAFRPQRGWKFAVPGSALGAYVALILWITGFKYSSASIAAILNQTSSLFIILFAALFLREPLSGVQGLAALSAFAGSVLVLM